MDRVRSGLSFFFAFSSIKDYMDYIHNSTSESISAQLKADVLPIFSSLPSIYNFHSRCVKSFPFLKPAGIGVFKKKKKVRCRSYGFAYNIVRGRASAYHSVL